MRRHIHCTATRDIFRRPHDLKKLLRSPIPRAQSLLSQQNRYKACLEKGQVAADSDRDLGYAPALPGMPIYLLK